MDNVIMLNMAINKSVNNITIYILWRMYTDTFRIALFAVYFKIDYIYSKYRE